VSHALCLDANGTHETNTAKVTAADQTDPTPTMAGRNFANILDVLGGTWCVPEVQPKSFGIRDEAMAEGFIDFIRIWNPCRGLRRCRRLASAEAARVRVRQARAANRVARISEPYHLTGSRCRGQLTDADMARASGPDLALTLGRPPGGW
jgi:hypothetical protein